MPNEMYGIIVINYIIGRNAMYVETQCIASLPIPISTQQTNLVHNRKTYHQSFVDLKLG